MHVSRNARRIAASRSFFHRCGGSCIDQCTQWLARNQQFLTKHVLHDCCQRCQRSQAFVDPREARFPRARASTPWHRIVSSHVVETSAPGNTIASVICITLPLKAGTISSSSNGAANGRASIIDAKHCGQCCVLPFHHFCLSDSAPEMRGARCCASKSSHSGSSAQIGK